MQYWTCFCCTEAALAEVVGTLQLFRCCLLLGLATLSVPELWKFPVWTLVSSGNTGVVRSEKGSCPSIVSHSRWLVLVYGVWRSRWTQRCRFLHLQVPTGHSCLYLTGILLCTVEAQLSVETNRRQAAPATATLCSFACWSSSAAPPPYSCLQVTWRCSPSLVHSDEAIKIRAVLAVG